MEFGHFESEFQYVEPPYDVPFDIDLRLRSDIVDIKPNNMEELTEVITAADFHPFHCNIMMYSTSRGAVKLGDMRQAALCDIYSKGQEGSTQISAHFDFAVL